MSNYDKIDKAIKAKKYGVKVIIDLSEVEKNEDISEKELNSIAHQLNLS